MPIVKRVLEERVEILGSAASIATNNGAGVEALFSVAGEICERLKEQDYFGARMMVTPLLVAKGSKDCAGEILHLAESVFNAALKETPSTAKIVGAQPINEAYWMARQTLVSNLPGAQEKGLEMAASVAKRTQGFDDDTPGFNHGKNIKMLHEDAVRLIQKHTASSSVIILKAG